MTSLNASCHFDPGNIAVMVVSGSAAHPSNCTGLRCSKPQSTRKIFLAKLKYVAQAQTTGRLTRSEAFARSRTKATAPGSSASALPLNLSISINTSRTVYAELSSISPVGGVPLDAILLLPVRHFQCSQGFPPTNQRWHERNRSLTRDSLKHQEEHRRASLLRPFATLFHLLQELYDFPSCFFVSHPSPVFALYSSRYLFQSTLLLPW